MIESGMQPVIVVRDAAAETTLRRLQSGVLRAGALARRLQPYVVQVPPNDRTLLVSNGHVRFEREDIYGEQFAVLRQGDLYAEETGLAWEEADYLGIATLFKATFNNTSLQRNLESTRLKGLYESTDEIQGPSMKMPDPNFLHWPERMLIILAMVAKFFFF